MAHADSLRVIGQLLEDACIGSFKLETDGPNYIVTSESLPQASEWVSHCSLSRRNLNEQTTRRPVVPGTVWFSLANIFRLETRAQLRRRPSSFHTETYAKLSQLLRTLGNLLERMNIRVFQIRWGYESVAVDFSCLDGQYDSLTNALEILQRLSTSSRLRRSSLKFLNSFRPQ